MLDTGAPGSAGRRGGVYLRRAAGIAVLRQVGIAAGSER